MNKSWYSWKGNQISWENSFLMVYGAFILSIIFSLLIWIYGQKLRLIFGEKQRFFKNKISRKGLFSFIGLMILIISIIRIVVLQIQDWPWKWEFLHLHLCRTFIIVVGFLLLFNKVEKIKYIAFFAILGATLGILFSNVKVTPELVKAERSYFGYLEATTEWKNAGFSWGMDNIFFYDFIFAHNFLIIIVVFLSVISGKKSLINIIVFYRSIIFMLIGAILVFFANWMMADLVENSKPAIQIAWKSNWLFLGQDGIGTLGKYSRWPLSLLTLTSAFILVTHIMFIVYTYLTSFEFYFDSYYSKKIKCKKTIYKKHFKNFILPLRYFKDFITVD